MVEDQEFALDMIPIADRFSVLDLKRLCERTLICMMSVENVARVFALADRYACNRLRSRALLFMTDTHHFHLVMKTDSFAELDKALILEILHSHKTTPAPAVMPSEPLPGNSATAAKAGQSKLREHRHARGGGGAGGSGTARPMSVSTTASPSNIEHGRNNVGNVGSSNSGTSHTAVELASMPAVPDGPLPSNVMSSTVGPRCTAAQPLAVEPLDDVAMSSGRSSNADEPPPLDISTANNATHNELGTS